MTDRDIITQARNIAIDVHADQTRRGGRPYVEHPMRVASMLHDYSPTVIAAAYLHDTIEDTELTADDLIAKGISVDVVNLVQLLTHHKSENYNDYLAFIFHEPDARLIKIADIVDNLSDDPTQRQKTKYFKALVYLSTPLTAK